MKNILKTAAILVLTLAASTACTRRVQVESEPNEPRYMRTSAAEIQADQRADTGADELPGMHAARRS